ncbi:MAG: hypothetical protein JRN45_11270, partial [Nitrososphaerota archaeon]|nr:hypothetical protein [Nitrososphaerota archaeon]
MAPTQMANVRKHFDRLGVPYIVISSSELRIDYSALAASTPPAAERTTLKAIQGKIEDMLQAISMPKGSSTEDTLRWVLSLFDAQER